MNLLHLRKWFMLKSQLTQPNSLLNRSSDQETWILLEMEFSLKSVVLVGKLVSQEMV